MVPHGLSAALRTALVTAMTWRVIRTYAVVFYVGRGWGLEAAVVVAGHVPGG